MSSLRVESENSNQAHIATAANTQELLVKTQQLLVQVTAAYEAGMKELNSGD